jgi:D-methionine transport system substrate-binding protein
MKKQQWFIAGMAVLALTFCSKAKAPETAAVGESKELKKILVGVLAREEPDINYIKEGLAAIGYDIEPRVFNDNMTLNVAVTDGSLDANYFQHALYLENFNRNRGTNLVVSSPPISDNPHIFVSRKYKTFESLPAGAKIAIAQDDSNRGRNLNLLAKHGYITIKPGIEFPTVLDITDNPKKIEFIEMNPRSMGAAFPDLDGMVTSCGTVYSMRDPEVTPKTAIFMEEPEVYYKYDGLIWTTLPERANEEWLKKAIEIMTSKEFGDWLLETFEGSKIPRNHS